MSVYWNERVRGLLPYVPGEQPKAGERIIKLNTNENPYPPPPEVLEAIGRAAARLRLYPDPSAAELREALAEKFALAPDCVFAGNGSDEVLAFAFAAFFPSAAGAAVTGAGARGAVTASAAAGAAGLPVLFPDVTYSFYPVFASLWNVPFRTVPLRSGFTLCPEDYRVPNGGVIFPNPNAPTGKALSAAEIVTMAELQAKEGRALIVDEAYIDFGAESAAPYIARLDNLLVVRTFSKGASLAGLRVGYALGQCPLIEALERVRDSFNSYPVDTLAAAGAAAAVRNWHYYETVNARIAETRERVSEELRALGWDVLPSLANFVFARPPKQVLGRPPQQVPAAAMPAAATPAAAVYRALRSAGILTRYFPGEQTKDFLRISIGTDSEMNQFLDMCKKMD